MNNKKAAELLGINVSAPRSEVEKAYKRAAMRHHPDRGGDADHFHQLKEAKDKLMNQKCPVCDGRGEIRTTTRGVVKKEPCSRCWGM